MMPPAETIQQPWPPADTNFRRLKIGAHLAAIHSTNRNLAHGDFVGADFQGMRIRVNDPQELLSQRETQVLLLGALGATAMATGRALVIEEDTVKTHRSRLYRKLRACNIIHATTLAIGQGILSCEQPLPAIRPGEDYYKEQFRREIILGLARGLTQGAISRKIAKTHGLQYSVHTCKKTIRDMHIRTGLGTPALSLKSLASGLITVKEALEAA